MPFPLSKFDERPACFPWHRPPGQVWRETHGDYTTLIFWNL